MGELILNTSDWDQVEYLGGQPGSSCFNVRAKEDKFRFEIARIPVYMGHTVCHRCLNAISAVTVVSFLAADREGGRQQGGTVVLEWDHSLEGMDLVVKDIKAMLFAAIEEQAEIEQKEIFFSKETAPGKEKQPAIQPPKFSLQLRSVKSYTYWNTSLFRTLIVYVSPLQNYVKNPFTDESLAVVLASIEERLTAFRPDGKNLLAEHFAITLDEKEESETKQKLFTHKFYVHFLDHEMAERYSDAFMSLVVQNKDVRFVLNSHELTSFAWPLRQFFEELRSMDVTKYIFGPNKNNINAKVSDQPEESVEPETVARYLYNARDATNAQKSLALSFLARQALSSKSTLVKPGDLVSSFITIPEACLLAIKLYNKNYSAFLMLKEVLEDSPAGCYVDVTMDDRVVQMDEDKVRAHVTAEIGQVYVAEDSPQALMELYYEVRGNQEIMMTDGKRVECAACCEMIDRKECDPSLRCSAYIALAKQKQKYPSMEISVRGCKQSVTASQLLNLAIEVCPDRAAPYLLKYQEIKDTPISQVTLKIHGKDHHFTQQQLREEGETILRTLAYRGCLSLFAKPPSVAAK